MTRKTNPAALLLASGLLACASTTSLFEDRGPGGAGVIRHYRVPFESVWEAVQASVRFNGFEVVEASRVNGYVLARTPGTNQGPGVREDEMAVTADAGERVAIFVDSIAPDVSSVEVVSKRRFALDVTPRNWTRDVFQAIEWELPDDSRADSLPSLPDSVGGDR